MVHTAIDDNLLSTLQTTYMHIFLNSIFSSNIHENKFNRTITPFNTLIMRTKHLTGSNNKHALLYT